MRVGTVEGIFGRVDIQDQVDSGVGESLHTLIVVLGVVDRVHADGVQTQVLELLNVTLAGGRVGDGVCKLG